MQARLRMVAWGLLTLLAATCRGKAEDVAVQSLDSRGRLTFSEVTNATGYRVDWTTNLVGAVWSTSAPPGVAGIPATGVGNRSVTVGVAQAKCFYRVEAVVTNAGGEGDYMVIDLSGGTGATSYAVSYLSAVPPGGWTDEYKTTKLVLRRISAGWFTMGSPSEELGRINDETQHQVTLTKDFYIGVFEVTQKQWERVMGDWLGYFTNAAYRPARPVERVSYYVIRENPANIDDPAVDWPNNSAVNADSFMGKLRAKTDLTTLDLPTESQWEYACRAGTATALNSGQNLTNVDCDAHMDVMGRYLYNGGFGYSQGCDPSAGTALVGSYQVNAWGLYDMHGNVWEWCLDWYGTYPGTVTNPRGAASGFYRVQRGGSWNRGPAHGRSADRFQDGYPSFRDFDAGFRLSMTLP